MKPTHLINPNAHTPNAREYGVAEQALKRAGLWPDGPRHAELAGYLAAYRVEVLGEYKAAQRVGK